MPPGGFPAIQGALPNTKERESPGGTNQEENDLAKDRAHEVTAGTAKRARPASELYRGTETEDPELDVEDIGALKKRQRRGVWNTPLVEGQTKDAGVPGRDTPSFLAWDPTPWQDDGDGKGPAREGTTARTPFSNLNEGEEEQRDGVSLPPPSTVRVAGAAKGATPMFVSLPIPGSTPVGTSASLRGRYTPATSWLGKAAGEDGSGHESPCKAINEEERGVDDHPDTK